MTLLELMVAAFVLGIMLTMLFFIYRSSASAWMKGDTLTTLRQSAQVSCEKLTHDIERSTYDSLSVSPDARGISFLSAIDTSNTFSYNPVTMSERWQKYLVYYYEPTQRELRVNEVSVLGSPQENSGGPIETFGAAQPVSNYFVGGRVLARDVSACTFTVNADRMVRMDLTLDKKRYGSERLEQFQLGTSAGFRNN